MRFLRPIIVVAAVASVVACSTGSESESDESVGSNSAALSLCSKTKTCDAPIKVYQPPPPPPPTWPAIEYDFGSGLLLSDDPLAGSVAPDSCEDLCHFNEAGDGCECGIGNGYVADSAVGCPSAYPYRKFVLGRWRCYQTP